MLSLARGSCSSRFLLNASQLLFPSHLASHESLSYFLSLILNLDSSAERIRVVPFIPIVFAGCDVCVGPTQRLAPLRSGFCIWTIYLGGRVA